MQNRNNVLILLFDSLLASSQEEYYLVPTDKSFRDILAGVTLLEYALSIWMIYVDILFFVLFFLLIYLSIMLSIYLYFHFLLGNLLRIVDQL